MIYLIDNQLPVGLVAHLKEQGLDAIHVSDCGLERAADREIWDYAKANDCVIVSKDVLTNGKQEIRHRKL